MAGVKGNTDNGWTWDLSLNHGENTLDFHTRNSINYSLGATSPRSFYDGTLKYQQGHLQCRPDQVTGLGPGLPGHAVLRW